MTQDGELCAYWSTDDWCGCDNVLRTAPGIRCPFDSDCDKQKKFCKYYTYNVIRNNKDGTFTIIINGKEIVSNIFGEDVVVLRWLLEEFDDAEEL